MTGADPWNRGFPGYAMELPSPLWYDTEYPAQSNWIRDWRQQARCTARRSTDGEPCQGWAMKGCTVCRAHGGRAPQVRVAALRRLHEVATEALAARACRRLRVAA